MKNSLLLILLILLSSCGYSMRGSIDIPESIKEVSIVSDNYSNIFNMLSRSLENSNIKITQNNDKSLFRIVILNESFNRRQLTISTTGRVNEYELIYDVRYELNPPNKKSSSDRITLYRDYSFSENNVMGNSDREDSIKNEMVSAAASMIFNKLKALGRMSD